ncbi:hypothetical protein GLP21_12030 [Photobacterium carnosum]|uniref:Uncharacterized protein n=1 Tax=Photobacterium carnosum TaxID=2023717 RepID=A0A2N4UVZ7_9GAMM|nr:MULTISPECIES: toprim domain-containing protein [Photobacterium]MCD9475786.1 hypothetical protein [Photobacterium phosphoreum]MCD9485844.1 hypothetical protein [Photobacterium iliopiscarium]MCD9507647.1 hypothetical protein [Photobacterium phosphoreum]MCD9539523.1 hypothetical protein [Photobacterium carnosum]MCD9543199.1 hypothetical protein [Photobacterium carnosum]
MYGQQSSKIEKVRALADGKWDVVFQSYPQLADAMCKAPRAVPCPVTTNSKRTSTKFRFFKDWIQTGGAYHNDEGAMPDGIDVISWLEGSSKGEAMNHIIDILGGNIGQVSDNQVRWKQQEMQKVREEHCSEEERAYRMNRVRVVAQSSIPAAHAPEVHAYLRSRGLKGDFSKLPHDLRYTNHIRYPVSLREEGDNRSPWYSALIGTFVDVKGNNCTLHRIFLNNGAKAQESNCKLMMSPPWDIRGGYIKLDQPATFTGEGGVQCSVLGYCEGIETALAIREATGMPMRPYFSATLLGMAEGINVQGVNRENTIIIIWADKDVSNTGQNTANTLAEKLAGEGYSVQVMLPEQSIPQGEKSVDWLDVYRDYGADAFPIFLDEEFAVDCM